MRATITYRSSAAAMTTVTGERTRSCPSHVALLVKGTEVVIPLPRVMSIANHCIACDEPHDLLRSYCAKCQAERDAEPRGC